MQPSVLSRAKKPNPNSANEHNPSMKAGIWGQVPYPSLRKRSHRKRLCRGRYLGALQLGGKMDLPLYFQICSLTVYTKKGPPKADLKTLAEGEGFEPSLPGVPVKRFSRPPHSAALPPFQNMYQPPKELVKKKAPKTGAFEKSLAERWGFEPQIRFWRIHDFQSCSLSQTRTSLQLQRFPRMQGCTLHHLSTG